jgi:hypothetical protein
MVIEPCISAKGALARLVGLAHPGHPAIPRMWIPLTRLALGDTLRMGSWMSPEEALNTNATRSIANTQATFACRREINKLIQLGGQLDPKHVDKHWHLKPDVVSHRDPISLRM